MQAARCGTEVDDDVDESFAGVVCTFDELLFVEILAPLNDVDSKNKIFFKNEPEERISLCSLVILESCQLQAFVSQACYRQFDSTP